jgi:hypothetical protein
MGPVGADVVIKLDSALTYEEGGEGQAGDSESVPKGYS